MGLNRKFVFQWLLLGAFSFLLGFSYNYHLPKIEAFLLLEVEKLSHKHSPVRVWAQTLHFHLLPLGIVLEDVKILPQPPLDKMLAPTTLKEVGARLAIWPLLRGDVRLSQIYIRDSEISVFLNADSMEGKKPTNLKFNFEEIYALPVDEIFLQNIAIQGRVQPQNFVFRIANLNILIENRYRSLFTEIEAPNVMVKPSGPVEPLSAQLELRALIEAEEMQISALKLKSDQSFVVASGHFSGDMGAARLESGNFDGRLKVNMADINKWESVFFTKPRVPELHGWAEMEASLEVEKSGYKIDGQLETRDLKVHKYFIDRVQGRMRSDLKTLTSDSIQRTTDGGQIVAEKLKVTFDPGAGNSGPSFSANLKTDNVELKKFLTNLDVSVPIKFPLRANAVCHGNWQPDAQANCTGELSSPLFHLHNGAPKFATLVTAENLKAKAEAKINLSQVEFKSDLTLGNSKGSAQGVVSYENGFKVNYTVDTLNFADVKSLLDLKIEGALKLAGQTEGTSKWGTVAMNVEAKDFWFEDYPLGNLSSALTYKAGQLNFADVKGQYGVTRFDGDMGIQVDKKQLRLNMQIPFAEMKDLQALFQRKIQLPFEMSGTGTGQIQAHGPLAFSQLNYTVKSNFYRGQIAEETFDELIFNVSAIDGLAKTERFVLNKGNGSVDVKGQITPTGEIDSVVVGRGMRLEQSEKVVAMGFDIQGITDFTVLIRGQMPKPRIELNGRLSRVVLGDQPAEDSVFKLSFLADRLEGSGQFLGSKVIGEFIFPYTEQGPFLFKAKSTDWDFTNLFSMVSKSARQIDFATALDMDINLQAPTGGFWSSTGAVRIGKFAIRKGSKLFAAEKPMSLSFRQGVVNSDQFILTSGDNYLKLDVADLNRDRLNASINGKMDLGLFSLFTPFISDLRGNVSLSMDLKGSVTAPKMSGSAYIDKGYVKIVDFYHAFSNIRADILFNDNQVLLNAVRADLASGKVSGEGKITFAGATRPVNIKGRFNEVKLNIPDGYRSNGSGTVNLTGDNFPYLMAIDYEVSGGEVIAEFAGAEGDTTVRASSYLPKFLIKDVFHPFIYDGQARFMIPVAVNNSLMKGSVTGTMRATGTPDNLILNGTVTPQPGGKIFFNNQPFDIVSAFVEYNNAPPNNPKLYFSAFAQVKESVLDNQDHATQRQYDITLLVQGTGQDPKINVTSQPPLGQNEIISLLALGVTGATIDEGRTSNEAGGNTGAAIGAAVLQKTSARRLKDSLGVDVKVSTSQPTPDNASQPKVTLSKQWSPKLGASASSTLEGNPTNNAKVEYKINKSVSAVGSWEGKESKATETQNTNRNVFGLDLEYKVNFK